MPEVQKHDIIQTFGHTSRCESINTLIFVFCPLHWKTEGASHLHRIISECWVLLWWELIVSENSLLKSTGNFTNRTVLLCYRWHGWVGPLITVSLCRNPECWMLHFHLAVHPVQSVASLQFQICGTAPIIPKSSQNIILVHFTRTSYVDLQWISHLKELCIESLTGTLLIEQRCIRQ